MNSVHTKEKIKESLLEIMKTKDITHVKVTELSDMMGISRGTFYLYYDSVYSVLQEIEDAYFALNARVFTKYLSYPCDDKYFNYPHPAALAAVQMIREHENLHKSLLGPCGDRLFQHRCDKIVEEFIINRAISEGYLVIEDKYRGVVAASILGSQRALFLYIATENLKATDEELAVILYRQLFIPFRTNYKQFQTEHQGFQGLHTARVTYS
jgi:AcrR family transcriptional regulator